MYSGVRCESIEANFVLDQAMMTKMNSVMECHGDSDDETSNKHISSKAFCCR